MVDAHDAAGRAALRGADAVQVDGVGAAVDRMKPAVAGALENEVGLYRLDQLGVVRVRLGVQDVDSGRTKRRDDEVAALQVGMRCVWTERGATGVPTEVVQFVADVGHLDGAYNL